MNRLNLAIFEDEASVRQVITETLADTPYAVVAEATTRGDALDAVAAMHAGELLVDAVLLDGNLDNVEKRLFSDAHAIYNQMHELGLLETITVVGISSEKLAAYGIPITKELDITKWSIVSELIPTLDALAQSN